MTRTRLKRRNPYSKEAVQYYKLAIRLLELEAGWTLDRNSLERVREVVFNTGKDLGTLLLKPVFDAGLQK